MNKKFNEKFSAFTLNVLGYLQDMLDYAINEPIPSIYQFSRSAYKRTALYRSEASEAQIRRKIYQLHKQGLIKFEHNKVNLTLEGKRLLNFSNKKLEPIRQPQSWDKIWRVVIWDIAEKQREVRDHLRRKLSQMGFVRIQRSIWVIPYDCKKQIEILRNRHRLGSQLIYIEAKSIEGSRPLKEHFKLK